MTNRINVAELEDLVVEEYDEDTPKLVVCDNENNFVAVCSIEGDGKEVVYTQDSSGFKMVNNHVVDEDERTVDGAGPAWYVDLYFTDSLAYDLFDDSREEMSDNLKDEFEAEFQDRAFEIRRKLAEAEEDTDSSDEDDGLHQNIPNTATRTDIERGQAGEDEFDDPVFR